jgi:hypothetical protein
MKLEYGVAVFCKSILMLILITDVLTAQNMQQQMSQQFRLGSAIIRVAEPGEIADTMAVWGDVRTPGVFLVPNGTTVAQLISYAGGPIVTATGDATIDWARYRIEINHLDVTDKVQKFSFRYNETPSSTLFRKKLGNWDQLNIQIRRKPNFRDYLFVVAPVLSSIVTTLVIIERI